MFNTKSRRFKKTIFFGLLSLAGMSMGIEMNIMERYPHLFIQSLPFLPEVIGALFVVGAVSVTVDALIARKEKSRKKRTNRRKQEPVQFGAQLLLEGEKEETYIF